jgi:hypothetical protein
VGCASVRECPPMLGARLRVFGDVAERPRSDQSSGDVPIGDEISTA